MPKIKILGSGREVGRAAILIEHNGRGLLLDYGVNFDDEDKPIFPGDVRPRDLEGLVLTHSHLDHIGAAPYLYVSEGPRLFGTRLTLHVSRLLLYDMIKLNGAYLPYDERSVEDMLGNVDNIEYGKEYTIGDFAFKPLYSGHIPGSASILVEAAGKRILYTSDINVIEAKLVGPARLDGVKADVVIVESTYGDTDHPPRRASEDRFYDAVREVVEGGGTVLVPAFSVSRGQEIAMVLAERDFEYPVWLDGMVRQVAEIYAANPKFILNPGLLMKALSEFRIVSGWQDRRKAFKKPGVVIASAGMLKGGPSLYYARRMAANPKNGIFMVSYQAPGTPGRSILEEGVLGEERIPVLARVEWFDFSSHIDQSGIISLLKGINGVEKVVLVHGDPVAQEALKSRIAEELDITEIETPGFLDTIEL